MCYFRSMGSQEMKKCPPYNNNQKQLGQERAYFTSKITVHHSGKSGQELPQRNTAYWLAPLGYLLLLSYILQWTINLININNKNQKSDIRVKTWKIREGAEQLPVTSYLFSSSDQRAELLSAPCLITSCLLPCIVTSWLLSVQTGPLWLTSG